MPDRETHPGYTGRWLRGSLSYVHSTDHTAENHCGCHLLVSSIIWYGSRGAIPSRSRRRQKDLGRILTVLSCPVLYHTVLYFYGALTNDSTTCVWGCPASPLCVHLVEEGPRDQHARWTCPSAAFNTCQFTWVSNASLQSSDCAVALPINVHGFRDHVRTRSGGPACTLPSCALLL